MPVVKISALQFKIIIWNYSDEGMKQGDINILKSELCLLCFTWFRVDSKTSDAPAQLTIFYAGTVNVFDGIPPEKVLSLFAAEFPFHKLI